MGFEPMNTGFADQRVSHFATGAHPADSLELFAPRAIVQLGIIVRANKNPTSRNQRVGHRRSNALKLSPGCHPRTAAATAGTEI